MLKKMMSFILLCAFFISGAWAQTVPEENEVALSSSAQALAQNDLAVAYFSMNEEGEDPVLLFDAAERKLADLENLLQAEASADILFRKTSPRRAMESSKFKSTRQEASDRWIVSASLQASAKDIRKLLAAIKKISGKDVKMDAFSLMMSRETYEQALSAATEEALTAFHRNAGRIAQTLDKKYAIHSLKVETPANAVPYQSDLKNGGMPLLACAENRSDACMITVTVSGKIKLEP